MVVSVISHCLSLSLSLSLCLSLCLCLCLCLFVSLSLSLITISCGYRKRPWFEALNTFMNERQSAAKYTNRENKMRDRQTERHNLRIDRQTASQIEVKKGGCNEGSGLRLGRIIFSTDAGYPARLSGFILPYN